VPKLIRYATIVIPVCCSLAFLACGGDDPVSPSDDTTRPTVVSVSPVDSSTFVSVISNISVTFSEAMDQATMVVSSLTIEPAIAGTVDYSDKVFTFDPDTFLIGDTTYTVTVSNAVKDRAGNSLASAFVWQFSTDLDHTSPYVKSAFPTPWGVPAPVNSPIVITFSEAMDTGSLAGGFQLAPPVTGSYSYTDSTLTFTPSGFLESSFTYEVTLLSSITDTAGNPLADTSWQFGTLNDTNPPTGAIGNPTDEDVVGNSTDISVSASDETGVEKVVFYIDGAKVVGSDDFTPPYEYTWDASGLDTGSVHQLTAEVFDVLGNSTFIDTIDVHYLWKLLITDDDEELIHRDINTVHVRSGGSLLEFRVETFGGWSDYVAADSLGFDIAIYLDTDQNRTTGDTTASDGDPTWVPSGVIGINDIGADYMIIIGYHGDILQSWTGSGWSNEGAVDVLNVDNNSNYFEVGVSRNRIGLPAAVDVVAFSFTLFKNPLLPADPGTYKWDWAPNEGQGHATYVIDGSYNGAPPLTGKQSISTGEASHWDISRHPQMPDPFD